MSADSSSMPPSETRKLAAIMFTDVVGFSRQMGADEDRMLRLLTVHNQIIQHAVADHHGTVVKTVGDAFLVDFPSVVHAVQSAQQIQAQFRSHNTNKEPTEQIHIRIGVHLGDIVQREGDVFGDGVNIASRLQQLAEPDTICISRLVYEAVEKKLPSETVVSLGRPKLKNIAQRFPVYALLPEPPQGLRQTLQVQRLKLSRRVGTVVFVLVCVSVLFLGGAVILLYPSLSTFIIHHSSFIIPEAQPPALSLPGKPSIVVLPFVNMSGDPGQEYFSDGITEELTASLSRLSNLFLISRNSAFFYKGKAVKTQDISRELGVRYVLEGSVRKVGEQVRITTQLIDATTDHHLWSERYDRSLKDIFALQDEIVQKIVTTLKLQLSVQEQGYIVRKRTDNLEAYDFYLRGLEFLLRVTKEANAQARQMFEKAIALDSQYAGAYTYLSWTYLQDWVIQWNTDPAQSLERAFALAQRAVALDDSLPVAHGVLSQAYLWKKQHEQAIAEGERAIALDPNFASAYQSLGAVLIYAGRPPEEGIGLMEKALRLNPRQPFSYFQNLGWAYRAVGRYEEAIAPLKKALTLNPNIPTSHLNLAVCYAELGRQEEARAELAEALRLNPNYSVEGSRQMLPFKDPAALERWLNGLRKAGLK
jgi:adenylate cyclase